jgi:hypothetical protein
MTAQITDALLETVMQHIRENPRKTSAGSLPGDTDLNLLAVRELRRRGLITGVFLDDPTRAGDQSGRFLADAARLEPA